MNAEIIPHVEILRDFIIGTCFLCIPYIIWVFSDKLIICKYIKVMFTVILFLIGITYYAQSMITLCEMKSWSVYYVQLFKSMTETALAFTSLLTILELYAYAKLKFKEEK